MTATDWIALFQGIALAAAAYLAWRTYSIAKSERLERLEEARNSEDRRLLQAVINEVKYLAIQIEERSADGTGRPRRDLMAGHLQRVRIAVAFMPFPLPQTERLAHLSAMGPSPESRLREQIEAVVIELAEAARKLAPPARAAVDESLVNMPADSSPREP